MYRSLRGREEEGVYVLKKEKKWRKNLKTKKPPVEAVIERGKYTFRSILDTSPPRSITPHGCSINISCFRFEVPLVVLSINLRCFSARPCNNGYGTRGGVIKAYDFRSFFFHGSRNSRNSFLTVVVTWRKNI